MADSRLFKPVKVGNLALNNRIAMAPLTRFRANDDHIPLPMVAEYYAQRAAVRGTLLVSEGTFITQQHGGYANVPGIYNQAQIDAWRTVTDAVHKKGSYIYVQLWALGRVADPKQSKKEGFNVKGASAIKADDQHDTPEPLTVEEIKATVSAYAQAAKNAIAAGFDGVELHGANGYLIDQFIQDNTNQRTDQYGGSIENRSRFAYEVTEAVVNAIGAERTGIRFSPFSEFQGMRMKDPVPQFSDIIRKLNTFGLSYVHLVEPRVSGNVDVETTNSLKPFVDLWSGPILIAGGFKPDSAKQTVDVEYPDRDVVVVFGRYFISTPDLVFRLQKGIELAGYDRKTFYNPQKAEGYTDYPFSNEFLTTASL